MNQQQEHPFYVWHWINNVFAGSNHFATKESAEDYIRSCINYLAPLPLNYRCDFELACTKAPHHQQRFPSPCLRALRG